MKKKLRYKVLALLLVLAMMAAFVPQKEVSASIDYRGWSQADSRWASLKLGGGYYSVKRSGCLATAITKLIIQAGLKDEDSFNVKTFVKWMNSHGGFTSGGALCWDKPAKYAGFTSYNSNLLSYKGSGYSASGYNKKLLNYIKKGYHLVISVKYGGHWVAVDEEKSLETGKIYIMDSASATESKNKNKTLQSAYGRFYRVAAYKGGKTADPINYDVEIITKNGNISMENAIVSGIGNRNYTGAERTQGSMTVSVAGKKLVKDTDYTVTYENNIEIGKATLIITGIGAYEGTLKRTFNIKVYKNRTYIVDGMIYKMTGASTSGSGTVTLIGMEEPEEPQTETDTQTAETPQTESDTQAAEETKSEGLISVTVGSTVKISGIKFKITAIGAKAFDGHEEISSVTLGTNIKSIGTKAFYQCSNLKTMKIKSKKLKTVGKNAIKGIDKKAVIRVPSSKVKAYKKLFKSKTGYVKTMKIKNSRRFFIDNLK